MTLVFAVLFIGSGALAVWTFLKRRYLLGAMNTATCLVNLVAMLLLSR